jgi:malate dehydrogenase
VTGADAPAATTANAATASKPAAPAVQAAPARAAHLPSAAPAPLALPPSGTMYRRNVLGPNFSGGVSPRAGAADARPKAGVVGAGHVGAMTALRLAQSDLFSQVTLVDVVPGLAAGLALDMWHGAGIYGFSTRLVGSEDLAALAGAEYIVITAGKPRQPGMSRTDLTAVNTAIMASVCQGIRTHAREATLVVVSNPLEEMTHLAAQHTGFPDERVIGMAGVLDSARFCALVGLTGKARPQDVRAVALGSHGPEMVIPLSQAFVGERPIESVFDADTLNAIVERARESGGEVVKLLQKGSAYFSPAESAATMVRAMVRGSGEVLAACVRTRGAYGLADTRVGLPVRLHRRGVKEIVPLQLRAQEQQALQEAAARIAARIAELPPQR